MKLLADGGSPTSNGIRTRIAGVADRDTLRAAFKSKKAVAEYIDACQLSLGDVANIETVVSTIELESARSRAMFAAQEMQNVVERATTASEVATLAANVMADVIAPREGSGRAGISSVEGLFHFIEKRMGEERPREWDWPFPTWNRSRKLRAGDIIVIGAASGHGKSFLGLQFEEAICSGGGRVANFSMEMSEEKLTERRLLMGGGVTREHVDFGTYDPERNQSRADTLAGYDYVTFTGRTDIQRIATETTLAAVQGRPFDGIIIDHLNLVRLDKRHGATNGLDDFLEALRTEIADRHLPVIVVLTQFTKMERQKDGSYARPTMEHLRGSAAIKQIADRVIFLHREGPEENLSDYAQIWNPKVRDGRRLQSLRVELSQKANRFVEA